MSQQKSIRALPPFTAPSKFAECVEVLNDFHLHFQSQAKENSASSSDQTAEKPGSPSALRYFTTFTSTSTSVREENFDLLARSDGGEGRVAMDLKGSRRKDSWNDLEDCVDKQTPPRPCKLP
ncbi:hypothetical protein FCV25MIE_03526 [Fagus crenata]